MKQFSSYSLTSLVVFLIPQLGTAAVLAGWDVNGIDLDGATAPNSQPYTYGATLAANITSGNLTLSTTVNPSTAIDKYGFKITGGEEQTSMAGALSAGHYFQFTINAAPNFSLNLTSIEMHAEATGTGANTGALFSSIAGFTAGNELASVTGAQGVTGGFDTDPSGFGAPIDLDSPAYQGVSSVTFRFYAWDTSSGSGTTRIRDLSGNDLIINGTVTAVPEPSCTLLGLAGAILFFRRRR